MKDLAVFSRSLIKLTFFATLFITPFIFTSLTSELFEIPKMIFVYFITATLLCLYVIYCLSIKKVLITKNPVLIFSICFILALGISTIFSTDHHLSVFGYYTRLNGSLFSSICYIVIFFVITSVISKKEVIEGIKFLVLSALAVSIWGIPGHFGYDPNCYVLVGKFTSTCWREEFQPTLRIFSTFGQPNWLGAFLTMTIPLAVSIAITSRGFQKIFFSTTTLVIFLALIFSNSRSAFLSLIISMFLFAILLGWKKIKTSFVTLLLIFTGCLVLLGIFGKPLWERNLEAIRQNLFFTKTEVNQDKTPKPTSTRSATPASTSLESGGTESGTIRLIVWQGAIDIFKNSPIIGSGPETFATVYYKFRPKEHNNTTEWNFLYNKAHNEYLNYLAGSGLVGTISYLFLIFSIIFLISKNIFNSLNQTRILQLGLLSGSISYLIVNFFGFSVAVTSLIFFIIPAISYVLSNDNKNYQIKVPKKIIFPNTIIIATVFIIYVFLALTVSRIVLADIYYARYQKEIGNGKITKALKNVQTAAITSPYFEPIYYAEIAYAASLAAENSFDTDKENFIKLSETSLSLALNDSPNNLSLWRKAQSIYFELSISDSKYLDLAINAGKITTTLAPTDPATFYNLGLIEKTANKKEDAKKSFSQALRLKPDYIEAKTELELVN